MTGEWHTWQLIWYLRANAGIALMFAGGRINRSKAMAAIDFCLIEVFIESDLIRLM
jgi:hypothetical protein